MKDLQKYTYTELKEELRRRDSQPFYFPKITTTDTAVRFDTKNSEVTAALIKLLKDMFDGKEIIINNSPELSRLQREGRIKERE